MLICFTFVICFCCPCWGALPFPFLSFPWDKLLFLGLLLPFRGALPLFVRLGGVSQWSTVLWLFLPHLSQCLLYLFISVNLWICDATALVCALHQDSSSMCQNLYVIVRYWDSTKGCPRVLDRGQVCVKSCKSLRRSYCSLRTWLL